MAFMPMTSNLSNPASEGSLIALAQALTAAGDPPSTAISGVVTVGEIAKELRVGLANLVGRKRILIQAQGAGFTWGFSPNTCAFTLKADELVWIRVAPTTTIYAIKASGSAKIAVAEFA